MVQKQQWFAYTTNNFSHHLTSHPQKYGSFKKDEEILNKLIEQAPNQRERQRLNRLQCEHSGAWVCSVPSTLDGNDTVMRPRNFQVAVAMRLGLLVSLH